MPECVVFLGDSLTHGGDWPRLLGLPRVANHGICGDNTRDILRRIRAVTAEPAERVFFMAGINDLSQGITPAEIAENAGKIVKLLQAARPAATICVQSVLPVNHGLFPCAPSLELIRETNASLARLARPDGRILFIDLHPAFARADGGLRPEFTDDGVHLTPAGYRAWADELKKTW